MMGNSNISPTTNGNGPKVSLCSMLRRCASLFPDKVATIDGDREKTWRLVEQRVCKIAYGLIRNGLLPEDRICLLGLNSDYYFEAMFAVAWAGGIVVPMNFRLSPPELNHIIKDSGAKFLLIDETFEKSVLDKLDTSTIKQIFPLGKIKEGTELFQSLDGSVEMSDRGGDDPYGIFYTGGTTGKAKGAVLSHSNLYSNATGTLWLNSFHGETKFLHVAPMFHLADAQMLFAATLASSIHVISPRFNPSEFLPLLAKHTINKVALIPVMIQMILNLPNLKVEHSEAIQKIQNNSDFEICYGGAVLPETTLVALRELLPNVRLFQGFGMTEMSPGISYLSNQDHNDVNLLGSIGQIMPWVEVRIIGEDGKPVPRGMYGEIQARSPGRMLGYWNLPELTAETLKNGWMHTGDSAKLDERGYLWLGDRIKDMIKTGGENVFSVEVEKVISNHPKINLCVVLGMKDNVLGERVVAVVTLKDPKDKLNVDDLKQFASGKLAPYKVPKEVIVKDSLPMSGAGKILKNDIRKELGAIGQKDQNESKTNYQ